ncbi:hypothetical protein REPUB_Repub09cG0116700 [Reevesia pubescens]
MATVAPEKKRPRPKFSVHLSKKEIEEDFMLMAGHRPRGGQRNGHVMFISNWMQVFILFVLLFQLFWCFALFITCWFLAVVLVIISWIVADGGDGGFLQGSRVS